MEGVTLALDVSNDNEDNDSPQLIILGHRNQKDIDDKLLSAEIKSFNCNDDKFKKIINLLIE